MIKIWTNEVKGDDRIIALMDDMVYKCNPKPEDVQSYVQSLKMNMIPQKAVHGVPLSYIREFRLQEGKNNIQLILGGGSEEDLTISNVTVKEEVFEAIKEMVPGHRYLVDKHSRLQAGKKPLIALGILTLIFLWTMFYARNLESGVEYEIVGNSHSLGGVVIVLASLGIKKVLIIFFSLMALAGIAFVRKTKNPPVIKRIIIGF